MSLSINSFRTFQPMRMQERQKDDAQNQQVKQMRYDMDEEAVISEEEVPL